MNDLYLDENFSHHLMGLKDSWKEVTHRIRLDSQNQECWWDLELLVRIFAEQLNQACSSNPAPKWPHNPFNRVFFTRDQMLFVRDEVRRVSLPVNVVLHEFFNIVNDQTQDNSNFAQYYIQHMSVHYRFKLYNSRDSQSNYHGCWVSNAEPLSEFEEIYHSLDEISPFEYDADTDDLVPNEEYVYASHLLSEYPQEEVDLDTYST